MGLYSGGRIIGRIFAPEIQGLIFGRAFFGGGGVGGPYCRTFTVYDKPIDRMRLDLFTECDKYYLPNATSPIWGATNLSERVILLVNERIDK